MSHEPDDEQLSRALRGLRPRVPEGFADDVMAHLPRPRLVARRRVGAALGVIVLAAAALLLVLWPRPTRAPLSSWTVLEGAAQDGRVLAPRVPTTLRPGDGAGRVVLSEGALALADGDALILLRGRARLEGRARVIAVQAEVAGTSDATVATVVVDPLPDAPESAMSSSLSLTKTAALLAALTGGSALAVTVASGKAELRTPPAAPLVVAAGERAELPAAPPTAPAALVSAGAPEVSPAPFATSAAKPAAAPGSTAEPECPPGGDCTGHCNEAMPDNPADAPRVVVDASGAPSLGPTDARVTLIEFSDFECPYCVKAMSAVHELREIYPRDVRLVFMNYPLPGHPHALLAAEAALAAGAQGKFWEMHDLLLANNDGLARPALESYAKVLGLDLERFRQDLDSHRFAARIAKDRQVADDFGIEGTPTFLFNGRIIRGARDVAFFRGLVDEELARK